MNINSFWNTQQLHKALHCGAETPYYFFDADIFRSNITQIRNMLPQNVKVCYAMKANTWLAEYAPENADYIEICSAGELAIAKSLGIPEHIIIADGVCKTHEELKKLAGSSLHRIVLESVRQAEILNKYALEIGQVKDVLLRLSNGNQFGMSRHDMELITARQYSDLLALRVRGIHAYFGTQKRNSREIRRNFAMLRDTADALSLTEIEFGPGLGVVQSPAHDKGIYSETLKAVCEGFEELAENHEAVIECGRLLCAYAGVYVTTVIERKIIGDRTFLITDGGSNHLIYDGQPYGSPAPFVVSECYYSKDTESVTICGALCAETDILAGNTTLQKTDEGKKIVFLAAGAYGVTEGHCLFLSRPLPAVVCGSSILRGHSETWHFNSSTARSISRCLT